MKVCLKDSFTLATVLSSAVMCQYHLTYSVYPYLADCRGLTSTAFASNEGLALGEPYEFPMHDNDLFFF